jgi:hypothetical protein
MRLRCVPFILLALVLRTAGASAAMITAHRYDAPAGGYTSPDGEYRVVHRWGEGEVSLLYLYSVGGDGRTQITRPILQHVSDADGFLWVPGRPHTLVFATCGLYGSASLSLWDGGRVHALKRVTRPEKECFALAGISPDGVTLTYLYYANVNDGHFQDDRMKPHTLTLPKRWQGHSVEPARH